MPLVEFTADDTASVAAFVEVDRAAAIVDCAWEQPRTTYRQAMSMRHGFDGEVGRYFLLTDDDITVATVGLFGSDYDNLNLAWVEVVVPPALRRCGYGRVALAEVLDLCRAAGRSSVLLYGWDGPAARGFAVSAGFELKSREVRRVHALERTAEERARFVDLYESAGEHAGDYDIVRISGRTPEEFLPGLVQVTAAINDAPRDGLDYEDEVYDADRVRAYEAAQVESGYRMHRVLARHRESGEIAGHTVVSIDTEQPAWGDQHDTAVLPQHRGRRLGLRLKSAMLLWLLETETELRQISTENAESNGPMIAVNELLGHRVAGYQVVYQRHLDRGDSNTRTV